jgi:transcriptional regulator with XRE-family HTH domain
LASFWRSNAVPRKTFTLAKQFALLFEYGQAQGLPTALRAVAKATGESPNNLQKIQSGGNDNPGLRTLNAVAAYFGVSLAYFDCKTVAECQQYLRKVEREKTLAGIAMRAEELSPEGRAAIEQMIEHARKVEAQARKKK